VHPTGSDQLYSFIGVFNIFPHSKLAFELNIRALSDLRRMNDSADVLCENAVIIKLACFSSIHGNMVPQIDVVG
jgi:hypothetical protein